MFGLFRKKAKPQRFWDWLVQNTDRIRTELVKNPQQMGDEIGNRFQENYPKLTWEIGPLGKESPQLEFIISADGNIELFPEVQRAVKEAPEIPGWIIYAFRQRGSLDVNIAMQDYKLSYDDLWCEVTRVPGGVDLVLFIRELNNINDPIYSRAALILVDNAVGEYDAVVKVKRLTRDRLPHEPYQTETFFPMAELPAYLDSIPE